MFSGQSWIMTLSHMFLWHPSILGIGQPNHGIESLLTGPFQQCIFLLAVAWPEVIEMKSRTTAASVTELHCLFSCYDLPKQPVSDNRPQFTSSIFSKIQWHEVHLLCPLLSTYRISPHFTTNVAPCTLFLKREVRTRFNLLHL